METPSTNSPAFANLGPTTLDKVSEFQIELDNSFEGYKRQVLEEALVLMCEVHADQKDRPDGRPYVEHPLGVGKNVLSGMENPDFEIIVAALLHDSVEDQAEKLAAKIHFQGVLGETAEEGALSYIESRFGGRVKSIVKSLTNPNFEDELTTNGQEVNADNKNVLYVEHVKEAIENPDVLPIKLFDFADNALRLDEITEPTRRLKLSKKYAPVISIFINRLRKIDHGLKQESTEVLLTRFQDAYEHMQTYITNIKNLKSG